MIASVRTRLLIAAVLVALTPIAGAAAQNPQTTAEKLDEFGDILATDIVARFTAQSRN